MAAGIPGWLAVVPAIVICACVGMLVELLAYRPVRKTGNNLTCLITAIAMSFVLENLAQAIPAIGPDPKVPYTLFAKTFTIGGVSVSHATIITRENTYFIVDTNSTNHTYVDGKMIQPNTEVPIQQGTKIRLGNEDFEFKLR